MSEWADSPASPLDLHNIHRGLDGFEKGGLADGFEEGGLYVGFEEGGLYDGFEEGGLADGFEEGGLDDGSEEDGLAACAAFVNEVEYGQPSASSPRATTFYLAEVEHPVKCYGAGDHYGELALLCASSREPRAWSRRAGANASYSIRVPPSASSARSEPLRTILARRRELRHRLV